MSHITVVAPVNIAFIKYWGKREGGDELILPANDSFSITLSTDPFRSKTSILLTDNINTDILWLNGKEYIVSENPRLTNVLAAARATAPPNLAKYKALIVSNNNFPTAAGMASSASGYCALATAVVSVFKSTVDVSMLSRIGSGSACRSAYGGFVIWERGARPDGTDCVAKQYADHSHWPEMQVLCAVIKSDKKEISSTTGMQLSLKTSPLMKERIERIVPARMEAISIAIRDKDFEKFAEITMCDSDDLQEICRTTVPPIQYPTSQSYAIIDLIRALNKAAGRTMAAYTFDAGANAFMFTQVKDLAVVIAVLLSHFPTDVSKFFFHDSDLISKVNAVVIDKKYTELISFPKVSLEMLLQSPVGSGPMEVPECESLIDTDRLIPK
eukprot:Tbor_TRINITY_DN5413_c0_g1::TRINITY_DN5413_c0_g1_i2::g.24570::m.24570/K01597/MVD, mvaD; diphosphomevalonate decarboxylase